MNPRYDVAVLGGGLVGASLALALDRAGVRVALVEPQTPRPAMEPNTWDSRVYTVSPGNVRWLSELGVWQTLAVDRVTRVEAMHIFGDEAGAELTFSAYDAGLRELAWTVESETLQQALRAAMAASGVEVLCPARAVDVEWSESLARVHLEGGTTLDVALVVGADGIDSWVRQRAGIACTTRAYDQLGVVANFACDRAHKGVAFQWFREDGVLAFLPLPEKRMSMVWSAREPVARSLLAMEADTLAAEVARASNEVLGALEVITPARSFPLVRLRAARLVEPRAALVGDAAHSVHPLAGQGMNIGLRDARVLADTLSNRGVRTDCGDYAVLRPYERARKEDILAFEAATDGLEKLFSTRAVGASGARNIGLSMVNLLPMLKNALVRRAVA